MARWTLILPSADIWPELAHPDGIDADCDGADD
jgi:hypothetical protein